jgi:hypothetical protein
MLHRDSRLPSVGRPARDYIFPIMFAFVTLMTTLAWLSFLGVATFRAISWTLDWISWTRG